MNLKVISSITACGVAILATLFPANADAQGNGFTNATPVGIGSVTSGVLNYSGDADYFAFTVTNTATYVMYTRGTNNTYGRLYNSAYSQVAYDNDSGENYNFRMVVSLTPGTYYV